LETFCVIVKQVSNLQLLMGGKLFCTFVFDILYIKMTLVSYLLLCR